MAADVDRCRNATMASLEVVLEECEGREGRLGEVADNVFTFIPEGALDIDPDDVDPDDDDSIERAVEGCMESDYAHELAEAVLGEDMSRRNLRHARRSICERLFP